MSYLDRITQKYWVFEEALEEYISKNNGSKDAAISAFASDLNFKKGKTAVEWKKNWTHKLDVINKKENKENEPSSSKREEGTSSNVMPVLHAEKVKFDNGSQFNYQCNTVNNTQSKKAPAPPVVIDSFSSEDDMPTRTTKMTLTTIYDDNEDQNLDKVWTKDDLNLSDYLLRKYRPKSIEYNNSKSHKELSLARRLALHHMFFFPLDKSKSCIAYLEEELINEIYKDINSTISEVTVPEMITSWAENVKEVHSNEDRFGLDLVFSEYLRVAGESRCEMKRNAAYILIDTIDNLIPHEHKNAEDTFVHHAVSPFLSRMFSGQKLRKYWSNTQLESMPLSSPDAPSSSSSTSIMQPSPAPTESVSSPSPSTKSLKRKYETKAFQPDFTLYAWIYGFRYDIFVVEIKTPKSSMAVYDLPKMCKEMKCMLDNLVNVGVESPSVCGLWVDGYHCKSYKMEIPYDGIYRMIQLGEFDLIKDMDDIVKIRGIMKNMSKLKAIIDENVKKIELIIRWKKDRVDSVRDQIDFSMIPRTCWLRGFAGEDKRVKKSKKDQ